MIQLEPLLKILSEAGANFVIVGGIAATLHGSPRATDDLDICYQRTRANYSALVRALGPYSPRLRTRQGDVPFLWDETTLRNGLNFTLETDLGAIDLLGEVSGLGTFDDALSEAETVEIFGISCRVISLDQLIAAKRATARVKDLLDLTELESIRSMRNESTGPKSSE